MNIKPLGDRILVERVEQEEQSKGGIIIPDTAKEKPQAAQVVALGTGKNKDGKVIEFDVKVGDKIFIEKYAGSEVKFGDNEYTIIREDSILAVVK